MKYIHLLIGAAAIALAAGSPAAAQSGGTGRGAAGGQAQGAATTPPRREVPQPTAAELQALRTSTYLNSGDYATAAALNAARQGVTNRDGDAFLRSLVGPSALVNVAVTDGRTGQPTGERTDALLVDAFSYANRRGSGADPGPAGSRPVSNYERAQTALIEQHYQTLTDAYLAATEVVELTGNAAPALRARAIEVRDALGVQRFNYANAVTISHDYDGRSFQSDTDALLFVGERTGATIVAQRSDPIAPLQDLLNAMAPGGVQGGRYVRDPELPQNINMDNAETIQRSLDRLSTQVSVQRHSADQFSIEALSDRQLANRDYENGQQGPAVIDPAELLTLVRAASNQFHDPLAPRGGRAASGTASAGTAAGRAAAQAAAQMGDGDTSGTTAAAGAAGRTAARAGAEAGTAGGATNAGRTAGSAARAAAAGALGGNRATMTAGGADPLDGVAVSVTRAAAVAADAIETPEPVPMRPDYPTVSAEERARIAHDAALRNATRAAQADAARQLALQAAQAEAGRIAAAAAAREAARVADENRRLQTAAAQRAAQNARARQLIATRFDPNASILDPSYAQAQGQVINSVRLEDIYRNSDQSRGHVAQSLSAAGTGPSSAGHSLSSAGTSLSSLGNSLSSAGLDYRDPAVESLNGALYQLTSNLHSPFVDHGDPARAAQQAYNAGSYDVRHNYDGSEDYESGGYLAASLLDASDYLRVVTANGAGGIATALAQPFNVVLTWGSGAYDLDLHLTGPLGETSGSRFHIYYAATGDLTQQPYAALIKDCICSAGSEVLLTSALNRGGVYRVSVFDYGDQSATSTNLANASNAQIQIVRGGTTQSVGNGTTIVGGRTILTVNVPAGTPGNTWVAAELDPRNGRITVPGAIKQNSTDRNVD